MRLRPRHLKAQNVKIARRTIVQQIHCELHLRISFRKYKAIFEPLKWKRIRLIWLIKDKYSLLITGRVRLGHSISNLVSLSISYQICAQNSNHSRIMRRYMLRDSFFGIFGQIVNTSLRLDYKFLKRNHTYFKWTYNFWRKILK